MYNYAQLIKYHEWWNHGPNSVQNTFFAIEISVHEEHTLRCNRFHVHCITKLTVHDRCSNVNKRQVKQARYRCCHFKSVNNVLDKQTLFAMNNWYRQLQLFSDEWLAKFPSISSCYICVKWTYIVYGDDAAGSDELQTQLVVSVIARLVGVNEREIVTSRLAHVQQLLYNQRQSSFRKVCGINSKRKWY